MNKPFSKWNIKKIKLDEIVSRPFFREKEIWFCGYGVNIGFEQDGKGSDFLRPVVILRKFNKEIFWGIPLTKTIKSDSPFYFNLFLKNHGESCAILSQIKLIDARRLSHKITNISKADFTNLIKKLKELFP